MRLADDGARGAVKVDCLLTGFNRHAAILSTGRCTVQAVFGVGKFLHDCRKISVDGGATGCYCVAMITSIYAVGSDINGGSHASH